MRSLLITLCLVVGCGSANGGGEDNLGDEARDTGATTDDAGSNGLNTTTDSAPTETSGGSCKPGATRACGTVTAPVGICKPGTQSCTGSGELGEWGACEGEVAPKKEECGNGLDDDCDGKVDEDCGCDVELKLELSGDCLTVTCPKEAPYPVGCDVIFTGGDDRGCVAYKPGTSSVFFKEGDVCSAGFLKGTLKCSCTPGTGLNATNCPINKSKKIYATSSSGCPD